MQVGDLKDMYEFVLPEAKFNRQRRSTAVPYQQVTEALKQEVNVRVIAFSGMQRSVYIIAWYLINYKLNTILDVG